MRIVMPIGISGSGKTTQIRKKFEGLDNCKVVCPDDIRYQLTGNISDQSMNKEVFDLVYFLIDECVKDNTDVFYDATNVNGALRRNFVNRYKNNPNVTIQYYILPADVKLSYQRIQKDIKNGVNRSNVPMEVLERQYKMYQKSLEKGFDDENVHDIIDLTKD